MRVQTFFLMRAEFWKENHNKKIWIFFLVAPVATASYSKYFYKSLNVPTMDVFGDKNFKKSAKRKLPFFVCNTFTQIVIITIIQIACLMLNFLNLMSKLRHLFFKQYPDSALCVNTLFLIPQNQCYPDKASTKKMFGFFFQWLQWQLHPTQNLSMSHYMFLP